MTVTTEGPLRAYMDTCRLRAEQALTRCLPEETTAPQALHKAMRYSALGSGKRIRPILCYAAGDALGELLSIKSAREQAEREREEQERRQQEEVERQAKIKEETAIAKEMEEAVSEQVLAFQFEDALAGIENLLARIETAPARKSLKTLQERCRRIQSLHEFLIERINAEPFRWGWGSGTAARDITAADATKITVAGGAVRWDKIPEAQLFRIVEHYQETSSVRATRRAEQWVGAAILAREHGATGRAAAYGANAVELLPRLRSDLERLAPIKR